MCTYFHISPFTRQLPYKKYGTTRQAEDTTDDLHRTQLLGRSKGEKSEHEEEILKLLCLEVVETG